MEKVLLLTHISCVIQLDILLVASAVVRGNLFNLRGIKRVLRIHTHTHTHTEATGIPTIDTHYLRLYPVVVDPEQELWGRCGQAQGEGS